MRIILLALQYFAFLVVSPHINAQHNIRLGYLFTFCPDSTKPAIIKSDYMHLDIITDSGSIFYSKDLYEKDKLLKANENTLNTMINSGTIDATQLLKYSSTGVDEVILKSYKSNNLLHGIYAGLFLYYTEPQPSINWQIFTDTMGVNGFLCQKATCSYGGRYYTAWFSSSVEITNGPWKFSGLPGVIVKIYDTQKYFIYELKEIADIKNEKISLNLNEDNGYTKKEKKKIISLMKSYYEDPTGTMQMLGTTTTNSTSIQKKPKYYNPQERE